MKKSNYLVLAVSALVSIFLLYLWYSLGFSKIDDPLDLVISIVWWALIVLLVVLIKRWEDRRQRLIRTVYLSPDALYNSETGVKSLGGDTLTAVEEVLENLEYGFKTEDAPAKDEFDYRYVIKTDEYKPAKDEDEAAAEDKKTIADQEPTWKGTLIRIDRENGNEETGFKTLEELKTALSK